MSTNTKAPNSGRGPNDDEAKMSQLENCLNDMKRLFEYENQEAFVLNFNLFNDNVALNESLKKIQHDCDSLTIENKRLAAKCDELTSANQLLRNQLEQQRVSLKTKCNELKFEHRLGESSSGKRSQSVPKRLNKTLNASANINSKWKMSNK